MPTGEDYLPLPPPTTTSERPRRPRSHRGAFGPSRSRSQSRGGTPQLQYPEETDSQQEQDSDGAEDDNRGDGGETSSGIGHGAKRRRSKSFESGSSKSQDNKKMRQSDMNVYVPEHSGRAPDGPASFPVDTSTSGNGIPSAREDDPAAVFERMMNEFMPESPLATDAAVDALPDSGGPPSIDSQTTLGADVPYLYYHDPINSFAASPTTFAQTASPSLSTPILTGHDHSSSSPASSSKLTSKDKGKVQETRHPESIPIDAVEPLAAYTCPICFSPPSYATITPCGHVLCGECLFTAVKTTMQRGAYTLPHGERMVARCPVCRAPIQGWDGKGGGVIGLRPRAVFSL